MTKETSLGFLTTNIYTLYYITKPLNRQIGPYEWISIDYRSLGRRVLLVYFAQLACQAYSALAQ